MPIRVSIAKVNRYLLHKQHLALDSRGEDVASVVRDVGPIGAERPTIPYISLWARMEDLERQNLDAALYKERSLLRVPCMRGSLYIVPATDYVAYYQATKPFFQRGLQDLNSFLAQTGRECDGKKALCDKELIQRVLEVTSSLGPHTIAELSNLLPALNSHIYYDPEYPDLGYSALGTQLIPALCAQGLLVRAQARGGWRSQLYTYTTLSSWLPQIDLESLSGKEGLRRVVEVYVAAFGPVTVGDISLWLGGYARRQVVATLMSLRGRLARIQILDSPGDYFMLKEQIDELRACSYSQPSVSLLPPRDTYPTAYSDPRRFLDERYQGRVFDRVGEPFGTVWLDGYIVGTWHPQARDEHIALQLFEPPLPDTLALVGEQARRLNKFLDFSSFDIETVLQQEETKSPLRACNVTL